MDLFSSRLLLCQPYKPNSTIFESSTPGTYYLNVLGNGVYEISIIGGGGGAAGTCSSNSAAASAGASGSGFCGLIKLNKGTYKLIVGSAGNAAYGLDMNAWGGVGGNSQVLYNDAIMINSFGGGGGHSWWRSSASPAALGALPIINLDIVKTILHRQGNVGDYGAYGGWRNGGRGILDSNTEFGRGGHANQAGNSTIAYPGNAGYIKIIYKGKR